MTIRMTMRTHPNDVILTNPIRIDALSIGDVVLLPVYGESRVMRTPFFDPAHDRQLITLIVLCEAGEKRLLCARNMAFQYEGYILD